MTNLKSSGLFAYLSLALGIICIGFSAIFVKLAGVPGPASAFYRVLVAAVFLIPMWLFTKRKFPSKSELILITAGGLFFALDLTLWNTSILMTTAATATVLANNAPVWVGLGAMFVLGEHLSPRYWLGLIISIAGMVILIGVSSIIDLSMNAGDLMAIGASVFYAAYLLSTQRVRSNTDTVTFMTFSTTSTVIFIFILNLILGTKLSGYSADSWMWLLLLGIISHLTGWLSINYALGHIKAAKVSVALLAQTIVTALLAVFILGEILALHQLVGGIMVLVGIYFVNNKKSVKQNLKD